MSGSSRDHCDECHQATRPRDHVVAWREFEHGPEAAADPKRCGVCHAADFCVACHSRPPRSHQGMGFREEHAVPGALDTRACLTCHQVDRCGAGCHL